MPVRYRNEYVKRWSEIAASIRWRLQREEHLHCDGFATEETRGFPEGIPFEIKATKSRVSNGSGRDPRPGRWSITRSSHETLVAEDGYYILVVYDLVSASGDDGDRMLIEDMFILPASAVDILIPETDSRVVRLSHEIVLTPGRVSVRDGEVIIA